MFPFHTTSCFSYLAKYESKSIRVKPPLDLACLSIILRLYCTILFLWYLMKGQGTIFSSFLKSDKGKQSQRSSYRQCRKCLLLPSLFSPKECATIVSYIDLTVKTLCLTSLNLFFFLVLNVPNYSDLSSRTIHYNVAGTEITQE